MHLSREQDCDTMQRNKLKFYTGKIKKREATSMEEKVNETTVQVDAELNKKKESVGKRYPRCDF